MFRHRAIHGLRLHISHANSVASVRSLPFRQHGPLTSTPFVLLTTTAALPAKARKSRNTIQLSDLPQGRIDAEPLPLGDENNGPQYPTVVLQARRNMNKFENCVLLTRVGGFYELYFEHAEEHASALNIKLASKKTSAGPVPMAGFPFFQLDRFLKVLVQDLGRHVAIAEEFPNDAAEKVKSGGLMHDRRVTRIITPGTLIDENFMDPYANNYVMAIHVPQEEDSKEMPSNASPLRVPTIENKTTHVGLAWLDLSTGQFFTQYTSLSSLPSILSQICPREVVLERSFELQKDHDVFTILVEDRHLISFSSQGGLANIDDWTPLLESEVSKDTRQNFTTEEIVAGDLVLNYVKYRLQGMNIRLQPPLRRENLQTMTIDKNSLRALEIKQTIRDGFFRGSLLHAIRRTVTKGGARLLNEWLGSPSTSLEVINGRQDLVARFIESDELCDSMILLLRRSHDCQRLVQKFALGRGDADDLLGIANTIRAADEITRLLREQAGNTDERPSKDCLTNIASRIDLLEPLKLARRIIESIDEDNLVHRHEAEDSEARHMLSLAEDIVASEGSDEDASVLPKGKKRKPTSIREYYADDNEVWVMKPAASKSLKKLHATLQSLLDERVLLSDTLRERLGAQSLTLRWSPSLGHIAHVKGKDTKGLTEVKTLSSSRSTRSFHLPEWTNLGQRLDQARFQIRREEQAVFQSLREQVVLNLIKLRRTAAVLDEIDIATSFSKLAVEQNLTRPQLNNSTCHTILGGRHPTVEGGLLEQGRSFVRNDCLLGSPSDGSLWLITGPNMAGKSTFLRQNALITIMAQVGCYVPAAFAEIGIVDAIFSRVGSADNLYHDQSTFMVEMLETAQILRQATPRSFVIMDEIGRGTTPEDGTAISYACLHHLVKVNQCRTLFATHFHAVADMAAKEGFCEPKTGPVQTYCTDVEEDGQGGFVYVHKLRRGINRQSHALKVARLAGLPPHAVDIAKKVLDTTAYEHDTSSSKHQQAG